MVTRLTSRVLNPDAPTQSSTLQWASVPGPLLPGEALSRYLQVSDDIFTYCDVGNTPPTWYRWGLDRVVQNHTEGAHL